MRHTLRFLIVGCLLLLAACGGDSVLGGATSTSTPAATLPTTLPPTTTTPTPATTTTIESDGFDSGSGTPTAELDSFSGALDVTLEMMGVSMGMTTDFTFVDSVYECVVTIDAMGTTMEMAVVATPDTLWLDSGYGFEESQLFNSDVQTVVGLCPASPTFWMSFGEVPWASFSGESDTINGIPAQRVDMTSMADIMELGALEVLVGGGVDAGMEITEAVFWIADPGGWPVAMQVSMVMLDLEGMGDVPITMHFDISNVNDPSLSIEVPPS